MRERRINDGDLRQYFRGGRAIGRGDLRTWLETNMQEWLARNYPAIFASECGTYPAIFDVVEKAYDTAYQYETKEHTTRLILDNFFLLWLSPRCHGNVTSLEGVFSCSGTEDMTRRDRFQSHVRDWLGQAGGLEFFNLTIQPKLLVKSHAIPSKPNQIPSEPHQTFSNPIKIQPNPIGPSKSNQKSMRTPSNLTKPHQNPITSHAISIKTQPNPIRTPSVLGKSH